MDNLAYNYQFEEPRYEIIGGQKIILSSENIGHSALHRQGMEPAQRQAESRSKI